MILSSLPEYETFSFDIEEKSSGSTTTHSDYSLPDYEAFYFDDDHIKEKSSGSTTTHSDFFLPEYDLFIFDLSIDLFPPTGRSVSHHEEFADELTHIISSPKYDYFYFDTKTDSGELIILFEENISKDSTKEFTSPELNDFLLLLSDCDSTFSKEFSEIDLLVSFPFENKDKVFDPGISKKTFSPTYVSLTFKDRQYLFFAYVVRILLIYFTYPMVSLFHLSSGSEDTIFDPGISAFHFSHRSKDYAKNRQKSVKTGQYRTQDWKSHQKPDQRAFFYHNQANEAKCQKTESSRSILAIYPKSKSMEKGKSNFKG
nr:hypothetical protein [Tanacetum cinerariifolium]